MKLRIIPPLSEREGDVKRRHQELIDALALYFDVFDWTVEKEADELDEGQLIVLTFPSVLFESTVMRILSALFPNTRTSVLGGVFQVHAHSLEVPSAVSRRNQLNARRGE